METVAPGGTVTGVGGCPEAWCCRWTQPHSSGGTQLPFCCNRPWKGKHTIYKKEELVQCFGSFGFNLEAKKMSNQLNSSPLSPL